MGDWNLDDTRVAIESAAIDSMDIRCSLCKLGHDKVDGMHFNEHGFLGNCQKNIIQKDKRKLE